MRRIAFLAASLTLGLSCGLAVGADPAPAPPDAPAPVPGPAAVFPPEWFFYGEDAQKLAALRRMDLLPAPELKIKNWLMGEPMSMADMRGKIVVLDFWGTWCGPCLQALPHTNEIAQKYADKGVAVVAICDDTKSPERAPQVIEALKLTCPVAMDTNRGTYKSYHGMWFPFYVLVDRAGAVRASGLTPLAIEGAIDALLIEQPLGAPVPAHPPAPVASAPPVPASQANAPANSWLEGTAAQRDSFTMIQGQPALPLSVGSWMNIEPTTMSGLKGKVVLLDFWGIWCGPCLQSVPEMNAISSKYASQGLVVIGVCHPKESDKMAAIAKQYDIRYPLALDTDGETFKAFRVNGTPDYYLIDRNGVLRFADVANEHVEDAIRLLLAEPAPAPVAPAH